MVYANIYEDVQFSDDAIMMTPLLETSFCRELRITMHAHQLMRDHESSFPVSIEVCEGSVTLATTQKQTYLPKGTIVALDGNVKHHIEALEESVIRLTIFLGEASCESG